MRGSLVSLRLPLGSVTVLLGPAIARRRVMADLDESSARCASGHGAVGAVRLVARAEDSVADRKEALDAVRRSGATIVLVDRVTDGLVARDRRDVLRELTTVAAVADGALRVGRAGEPAYEPVGGQDYLAS